MPPQKGNTANGSILNEGHQLRSQVLDGFVELEQVARSACSKHGLPHADKATLGQRLASLRDRATSDDDKARVDEALELLDVRNDLVHSKLAYANLAKSDGGPVFLFRNLAKPSVDGVGYCRTITVDGFKALRKQIERAKQRLQSLKLEPAPAAPASSSAG